MSGTENQAFPPVARTCGKTGCRAPGVATVITGSNWSGPDDSEVLIDHRGTRIGPKPVELIRRRTSDHWRVPEPKPVSCSEISGPREMLGIHRGSEWDWRSLLNRPFISLGRLKRRHRSDDIGAEVKLTHVVQSKLTYLIRVGRLLAAGLTQNSGVKIRALATVGGNRGRSVIAETPEKAQPAIQPNTPRLREPSQTRLAY